MFERHRGEALLGVSVGVILAVALVYLVGIKLAGDWKLASDRCAATPPGTSDSVAGTEVHSSSAWLPYWDCMRTDRSGRTRHVAIHVWWP